MGAPLSFTLPWAIILRASLVESLKTLADDGGQVDGVAGRKLGLAHLVRRAALPHHAREVCSASVAASSPCERRTTKRASSSFASRGSSRVDLRLHHEPVVPGKSSSEIRIVLAELLLGRSVRPM